MKDLEIKLIVFGSFCIGNITGNIRTLGYEYTQDLITIFATTFDEPTNDDLEGIDTAITEIMSSLPNLRSQKIKINSDGGFVKDNSNLENIFFIRKECYE